MINLGGGDNQIRSGANVMYFEGAASGYFFDKAIQPNPNDGAALGSATFSWSDIFLANGGVINFNNGNYTVTHTSGTLTFSGAVLTSGAGGIGYAAGAGGTVTQAPASRLELR